MSKRGRYRTSRHQSDNVLRYLGEGLAELRRSRGISEQALADAVQVTPAAIHRAESGTNSMGVHQFLAMIWELDATDAEILELLRRDAKAREAA